MLLAMIQHPSVGVVMGSRSDWETMQRTCDALDAVGVSYETRIVSAHRTPKLLVEYGETARRRGLSVLVAGAGGAAHLPGMLAAMTTLPVIGVPVRSPSLSGLDSLLSIVQMPAGIPVATVAIGEPGATNAGLLAAAILAVAQPEVAAALERYRSAQTQGVLEMPDPRS